MKKPHRFAGVLVLGSDKEKTRRKAIRAELTAGLWPMCAHGHDPSTRASHEEGIQACRLLECEPKRHAGKDESAAADRICERLERMLHEIQQLAALGQKELPCKPHTP